MPDPDPPPVTVRVPGRGAVPAADPAPAPPRPERSVAPVLVLLALAALAVVVGVQGPSPPLPDPSVRQVLDAHLELRADSVSLRQGGVLVVPVVLHNRGGRLRLRSAEAYAEPVRSDTATTAPPAVGPGESRRFVVLLEPDCRFLTPTSGLSFRAGLLVVVADRAGAARNLDLDLGTDPSVASVVAALCRRT